MPVRSTKGEDGDADGTDADRQPHPVVRGRAVCDERGRKEADSGKAEDEKQRGLNAVTKAPRDDEADEPEEKHDGPENRERGGHGSR